MRRVSRFHLVAAAVILAICAFTQPTFADTQSASGALCGSCGGTPNGYTLTGTLTGPAGGGPGTYTLTYTVTNDNTSGNSSFVQDWSLTLFGPGSGNNTVLSNLTGFTASQDGADYTAVVGKASNGGSCHETITTAVCASVTSGTPTVLGPGQSITFSMSFTCSGDCVELANWDFIAAGSACPPIQGNCFSFSANGTPGAIPEPSSLALLGSGLVGLGGMIRYTTARSRKAP